MVVESHRGHHRWERVVVLAPYLIGRRDMMTVNISSGRLLMKSRPAGVAWGSFSTHLCLLGALFSTFVGDENLCLLIRTVLWCFSSPGIATPSDGALPWHPHTLTALRTQSGTEDAGGERGLWVWPGWGAPALMTESGGEDAGGEKIVSVARMGGAAARARH